MKWEKIIKIKVRDYIPVTASSKYKLERKQDLYEKLKKKVGKDLSKIKKLSIDRSLAVDVCYYLSESDELGKSKKDLDNLLKILFDVLSVNMINGQELRSGLGIMKDDTYVYKIKCRKKVNFRNKIGFDLKILRQV